MKGKTDNDKIFFSISNPFKQIRAALGKNGVLAMISKNNSVGAKLKKKIKGMTSFLSLYSTLHQKDLCATSLKMHHVMDTYMKCKFYLCK
jgi:hypothetical protein